MRALILVLMLAGCAAPMPAQMPEGVVCVSTLTTTVVTIGRVSGPMTIGSNCAVKLQ